MEAQQSAVTAARAAGHRPTPGLWPAGVVTVVSGVVCWSVLASGALTAKAPQTGPLASASELRQVDEQDVQGALTTMNLSPSVAAEFKDTAAKCKQPLAWLTLASETGQQAVKVRLRSGAYLSPLFELSNVPIRVAVPYPAPYETGHGTLQAMHSGGGAAIALLPAWHVPWPDGASAHEVTWRPVPRCKQPNG
jgi:hypothetical protein